jgi:hypothetical protein
VEQVDCALTRLPRRFFAQIIDATEGREGFATADNEDLLNSAERKPIVGKSRRSCCDFFAKAANHSGNK